MDNSSLQFPKYSRWIGDGNRLFVVVDKIYSGAGESFKVEEICLLEVEQEKIINWKLAELQQLVEKKILIRK